MQTVKRGESMDSVLSNLKDVITEEEVITLICDLVEIQSYKGIQNQETQVANYIHNIFRNEGIESELVHVSDGRYNVIGKIRGTDSGKTLLLTGHTDTVPPYDMENPFQVTRKDGKLF